MPKRPGARTTRATKSGGAGKRKIESFNEFPTEVLACRSLRHAWNEDPVYMALGNVGRTPTYDVRWECRRCPTVRTDVVKRSNGEYVSRSYSYPPDYLISRVKQWGGRSEFNGNVRLELYGRIRSRKRKAS